MSAVQAGRHFPPHFLFQALVRTLQIRSFHTSLKLHFHAFYFTAPLQIHIISHNPQLQKTAFLSQIKLQNPAFFSGTNYKIYLSGTVSHYKNLRNHSLKNYKSEPSPASPTYTSWEILSPFTDKTGFLYGKIHSPNGQKSRLYFTLIWLACPRNRS